jgi:uncharacterized protein YggU (UPF0235/DUF167 family)
VNGRLAVRVHPGARQEGITGRTTDGAWTLAVRAVPEGGRANRAVERLLAVTLGIAPSRVTVVRGLSSRAKLVDVHGIDDAEITRRLGAAIAGKRDAHDE